MEQAAVLASSAIDQPDNARLFVVDARHGPERKLLIDWVHTTWGDKARWVSLPLAGAGDDSPVSAALLAKLAAALGDDGNLLVIPLRVVWRIPGFETSRAIRLRHLIFGDPRSPGALRARAIIWRDRRRAQVVMGEAATATALLARYAAQGTTDGDADGEDDAALPGEAAPGFAAFVGRQALLALEVAERGVRGARYKVPRLVAAGLWSSPRFRAAMTDLAAAAGRPSADVRREARAAMKELVALPNALFLDLRARLDRFMLGSGYETKMEVDAQEVERLRAMLRAHPTAILFTHKTYIDGITPNRLLYENDLPMLHSFGGANLDFFPIGGFFRRSGIIYIRRTFQDQPVYKAVLRHYIGWLLSKRFPLAWAFEGTRSRLGKLMPPRYGLMKYVLDAAHATGTKGLRFVPFVTSFDLIRDVEEYAAEQTGRTKKPESLGWFIGYLKSLREPMGRVRIDIGEPVVMDDVPEPDDRRALERIAFAVAVEANRVTPLTVTSVMCLVLLGIAPRGATVPELLVAYDSICTWARERGIRLSRELASGDRDALRATVDTLVASGLLLRHDQGDERVYSIEPARHPMASYYRNSIAHHFLDRAIIEVALFALAQRAEEGAPDDPAVRGDLAAAFWARTDALRDLFKFEFFYPPREAHRTALAAELDRIDSDWAERLAAGRKGVRALLRRCRPLVGHAILLTFIEACLVVAEQLVRLDDGAAPDERAICDCALAAGRQAYLLRRISSEASIGKLLFANGYQLMRHRGLTETTTADQRRARRAMLRDLRQLAATCEGMRLVNVALADQMADQMNEMGDD